MKAITCEEMVLHVSMGLKRRKIRRRFKSRDAEWLQIERAGYSTQQRRGAGCLGKVEHFVECGA